MDHRFAGAGFASVACRCTGRIERMGSCLVVETLGCCVASGSAWRGGSERASGAGFGRVVERCWDDS